jgi:murein DD-endopeptidase MepM/ murein hydrolase activator NlpD
MKHLWYDWGMGVAGAALLGAGLVVTGTNARAAEAGAMDALIDPRLVAASLTSADFLFEAWKPDVQRVTFKRNETLTALLDRIGAPRADANGAVLAAAELVDLRRVRPGQEITAWLERDVFADTVRLAGLTLQPEAERRVIVSRSADGAWVSRELLARMTPEHGRVAGAIETSIYDMALSQGAGDQQVVDFADIFAYDIDFQREIHPGDGFEILYETFLDERGAPVKHGAVLYAALDGRALKKRFYRFTPTDDGVTDYFDETGQSARKFLMKTPINGARLSSGFGNRRHPILGYTKLHKGTDFAAPRGTPVYAAGNGTVSKAGPNGSYGNYVRIKHANGYETAYAHLNGFAKGVKSGRKVKQGEVIGYVGTTGRSTGPHLHYEVWVDGKAVNAMTLKLPTGRTLEGDQLAAFLAERDRIDGLRAAKASPPPQAGLTLVSAPAALTPPAGTVAP